MINYRIESDSMGEVKVSSKVYWGAQTQRSLENFQIGFDRMPLALIHAFGMQKLAAVRANMRLGMIDGVIGKAVETAAIEVMKGLLDDHFPLLVWQTGSGTQTNMNLNEVISNRAIELLGGELGSKTPVHPNDQVNCGQSSNDSFPTAMNIATVMEISDQLLPALELLKATIACKMDEFSGIVKVGRTHLQDATPITLSQEFSGYHSQISAVISHVKNSLYSLCALAQGGSAVGTGLNTVQGFDLAFAQEAQHITQLPFYPAQNKFAQLSCHDDLVQFAGVLNTIACALLKMANDLRLLGSGPRCGFGELQLPENEPGSSIMPGKVNPTQCEAVTMVAVQVMGNNAAVTIAGSQGNLELNVFKPVIIHNILQSIQLLSDGMNSFVKNCLQGIRPNEERIQYLLENSLMLVTALNPHVGYDNAAKIAKKAFHESLSLRQAAADLGLVTQQQFDQWVRPEQMLCPIEKD